MFTSLSLRFRIFLLFAGVTAGSILVVGFSLYFGFLRTTETSPASGFVFAAILSGFGLLAISAGVWLLFDENVAKPIEHMASAMRTRIHANTDAPFDLDQARYLGDLAPALRAVSGRLSEVSEDADQLVAEETSRLTAERAHLALLLTEIPVAIVLVSPANRIMLYDGQAADVLGQVQVPRLSASIFDYFEEADLTSGLEQLDEARQEVEASVRGTRGNLKFRLRLKKLSAATGYMILIDGTDASIAPDAARPLIYDFDLSARETEREIENIPLKDISFVVFDTETTGLMPNKDEIVQIGAVRVVNGRIVEGETLDQLVNPGRPIPPASTKVHGVSDDMVADAPGAEQAVSLFHDFARDAVIVAHNAPFDMAFLRRHGRLSGLAWEHPILDTVLLSAVVFGTGEDHSLDGLCDRLGVEIPDNLRHTALGDARATAEALCKLLPVLISLGFETFGQVVQQTRRHGRLLKDLN
ncbi:3'-5' exonuclease [Roseibium porphyridii]|uniref:DNA-directed DNA polymerase n=1 Tax=Roseibium porphyridii TaxID=2866279 RepID=A0ABY8F801_9HYPH|nr:3'-5' exonuclease [Roseibium sp. KMA01]WFE91571.1 3'-5' exonuclease [Roseibium sp. KMA01]